jgi:hypothetical protein
MQILIKSFFWRKNLFFWNSSYQKISAKETKIIKKKNNKFSRIIMYDDTRKIGNSYNIQTITLKTLQTKT